MVDFFHLYSLNDIIVFTIGLILFLKAGWDLADFFIDKYKKKFNKDYTEIEKEKEIMEKQEKLEEHYLNCKNQHEETLSMYNHLEAKIDNLSDIFEKKFSGVDKKITTLAESDLLDIKHSIVQAFRFFVEVQGWVDDFALDILEKRFKIYQEEGGNSYVESLMNEIRQLPKRPPE